MSNLSIPAAKWLREQFEYCYCDNCGGDAQHHTAIPVMDNWFARCDYPAVESNNWRHPVIRKFRYKKDGFNGSLTGEENEALRKYAETNGRRWKAKLRDDWEHARIPGVIQRLRNASYFGPRGLIKFKL